MPRGVSKRRFQLSVPFGFWVGLMFVAVWVGDPGAVIAFAAMAAFNKFSG
jgi:hypothetical protein